MLKKFFSSFLAFILLFINIVPTADTIKLDYLNKSIEDGQQNVPLIPTIAFEFNLRVDPCLQNITINGGTELIEKVVLSEGKKLEIILKEPLRCKTQYIVSLAGVRDIYESTSLNSPYITFETKPGIEFLSEYKNKQNGTYRAEIKNTLGEKQTVTLFATAKNENQLLGVKVITKEIQSGETEEFSHTFLNIKGEYNIRAYAFRDMKSLLKIEN